MRTAKSKETGRKGLERATKPLYGLRDPAKADGRGVTAMSVMAVTKGGRERAREGAA